MPPEPFSFHTVSRETINRLHAYADLLKEWTPAINLIAPSTVDTLWQRHIEDSAQLLPFVQKACSIVDLGTGGGLPSMVLAILGCPPIHAIESDARKCTFLHECVRLLQLSDILTIHHGRIETIKPLGCDVVVSRACAPLDALVTYAQHHMTPNGRCFFLKGKQVKDEINVASTWRFDYTLHPSITSPDGVIVELYNLERKI
jgi:16S rRNA (guanine527-N7)-methyltransferase